LRDNDFAFSGIYDIAVHRIVTGNINLLLIWLFLSRLLPKDGVIGLAACDVLKIRVLRFRLMVKRGPHLRPQASEKTRSMDYFAGLDLSVKETSVCVVDDAG
jgi:Transposase